MGSMTKGKTVYDETKTKENSTQHTDPWAAAAPDLTAILGQARDLYNSNPSGLGSVSDEALRGITDLARSRIGQETPQGTQEAQTYLRGVLGGPGPASVGQMRGPGFRQELGGLQGPSYAETNLADVAAGKNLGGDNPYVNDMIARGQHDAANEVAARFAASGRYGSGQFAGALADRTGRIATETLASQYDKERQRQVEANQLMEQGKLGRTAARMGVRSATADIEARNIALRQQDIQNQMADRAAKTGIAGMLPGFDQASEQARYAPWQAMLTAGQMRDQAPWQQLGLWSGMTTPMAQAFGTTTGQKEGSKLEPRQEQSPLQSILGAGMGIGGLAAKFYTPGVGFSDERVKDDVKEVGETHDGQPIYSYTYKGSQEPRMGLLAQDVEKRDPGAVVEVGGIKAVNYDRALAGAKGQAKKKGKR